MPEAPEANVTTEAPVLIETENFIRTITINRPHRKNALDGETETLLSKAIHRAVDYDDARVIILTGAGGDFCAGADLASGMSGGGEFDVTQHLKEEIHPTIIAMRASNKPFIAKVRGNAVGLGCNFALMCDMIFASETARFSEIFVRIGLSTDGGGSYLMPRRVGYPKAFELITTGAMIAAPEAERLGIINRACADGDLDEVVADIAGKLAGGPFVAIQRCKANLRESMHGTLQSTLDAEAESQGECFKSADFAEGVMAFMGKRKPEFKGK